MNEKAQQLVAFLTRQIVADPEMKIGEDTPLVSTGVIDSFGLVEVLGELERVTRRRLPADRLSPEDFETVARMLETAERVGFVR